MFKQNIRCMQENITSVSLRHICFARKHSTACLLHNFSCHFLNLICGDIVPITFCPKPLGPKAPGSQRPMVPKPCCPKALWSKSPNVPNSSCLKNPMVPKPHGLKAPWSKSPMVENSYDPKFPLPPALNEGLRKMKEMPEFSHFCHSWYWLRPTNKLGSTSSL